MFSTLILTCITATAPASKVVSPSARFSIVSPVATVIADAEAPTVLFPR